MSVVGKDLEICLCKDDQLNKDRRESVSSKNTTDSLLLSEETENENCLFNEQVFEEYFNKYYVSSSDNSNLNFDAYIQSALRLINKYPKKNFFKSEIERKKICLNDNSENKKTLILDLDETLVHADIDFNYKYHDEMLKFVREGANEETLIPLILRPYLFDFLNYVSQFFEIIVFTASEKNYADAILNYIEKDRKYFSKRLYRDSCLFLQPCFYIKDLEIVSNRNLSNVIIVDNSIFSFGNNLDNGILISSFYNDQEDNMLFNLANYLSCLVNVDDIRTVNKDHFQFQNYLDQIKKEENK